ncbi:uncharacterized protein [Littorina saxatilis]
MIMTSEGRQMTSPRERVTQCVKTGPCSCRTADGVIDLSPLADNVTARYKDVPDSEGADMYSWNPCLSFTETPHCVNVAACQRTIGLNESQNIGTQDSAQFVVTDQGDLTLQYTYPDPSGANRTTIVTLLYYPHAHDMIAIAGEMVALQYSITLMSKFACVNKDLE